MFAKLLIANRGEIAVRIIRACHALGVAAVVVYSEADRRALHVRLADEALPIGPAPAPESYLRIEAIIEAALRSGAQAIHPGYGFLAERAAFARACRDAGLIFVGPPPEAIEALGDKIAARRLALATGVPIAPGYHGADQSDETLTREAARIGYPLLIKASAGGGGRGMRIVKSADELSPAVESARREARAAFGDDTIFLEKLLTRPRHIEVQILADSHGNDVHLFERECSIQRRHQKIVEESPSPVLTPKQREMIGEAAVRLARAAGYVNAGTAEFLYDETDGSFAFLEVNTRLQVEHPITEAVTGVDLVQLQIAIASGARLPFRQEDLQQRGHAIEVRLCAEDPVTFLPTGGRLTRFDLPHDIRCDAGVETGDEVTLYYDSLLAKLIVHADNRAAAIARLRAALDACAVEGVTTNLPLLRAIAAHPAFIAGETTTDFLTAHEITQRLPAPAPVPDEALLAAAIADVQSLAHGRAATRDPWGALGPWRMLRADMPLRYRDVENERCVRITEDADGWRVEIEGRGYSASVLEARPDHLTLRMADGRIERFGMAHDGEARIVAWRGQQFRLAPAALELERLGAAGHSHSRAGLEAPMPGTIARILVREGDRVSAHQPLVVLEAMKMEHIVAAPHDGIVLRLPYAAGALVAKGATLVELEEG
ncbi:MAG: acetyl-CoA carboxylase biotin carboxylase subunit [Roseiflexaceae bacterium]|nr:acetyl-CoA carboxylase biotin carboxylase subunit [Roseiflexaceae bacterium]